MPKILHSLLPKSLHFWLPFTPLQSLLLESAKLIKLFLSMVLNSVASKNNLDFLTASGSDIKIRLNKIPGFSNVLEHITPSVIEFTRYGVEIYAKIDCSGLNVPPISLSNVPGISE